MSDFRFMGVFGIAACLGIAFLFSRDRKSINWKTVGVGLGLQLVFAVLILKTPFGRVLFDFATGAVTKLLSFSTDGARFLFGNLVDASVPVTQGGEATEMVANTGAFFAFNVVPTVLFFSALTALLYYIGVLPRVVRALAFVMRKFMGTSGAESLSAAANIFVGQTEAPLVVKPYLSRMTQSELMAVMTGGFATVAGGVMAIYVAMLKDSFPDIAGHLMAASIMSAPASLVMAKMFVPETEEPVDAAENVNDDEGPANLLDAVSTGIIDGLQLALNVAAMIIAFVALVSMINWLIGALFGVFTNEVWTLQRILGSLLAPFAFLLGVPWVDAVVVGSMMGTKTIMNEFLAYLDLAKAMSDNTLTHPRSIVVATYALCGFSNLSSIGIQIGGLSAMAPNRRADLSRLGFRSMIAASLACFQTAALAGLLI